MTTFPQRLIADGVATEREIEDIKAAVDNDVELAIVDVDIGIFTSDQDEMIRGKIADQSGIPFENIRLAYSHTHSGPITFGQWIKEGIDLANEWWDTIPDACVTAVVDAKQNSVPARAGFGRGSCDININRRPARDNGELFTGRNWDGFVDHDVDVIAIDEQMVGRECCGNRRPAAPHIINPVGCCHMFHDNAKFRQTPPQRIEHTLDEHRLTIEDVDLGIRDLPMDAQRNAGVRHDFEYGCHGRDIADA